MYEYIKITDKVGYIDCPAKAGIIALGDGSAVTIDSGSDKDAGKKIYRILTDLGLSLKTIYNTHSHADHIGGNKFLQDKTGCKIYAKGLECDFVNHTIMEPASLYGGKPLIGLENKFMLAQPSEAFLLTDEVLPEGLTAVPLPGHSPDMVGFKTEDGIFFIGDAICSEATLQKYAISYTWDIDKHIKTLEDLKQSDARLFVPAHAPVSDDITKLIDMNIASLKKVGEILLYACKEPISFENLMSKLFTQYGINMNLQQFALVGCTVRSYLTWLYELGKINYSFENNYMLWQSV